MATKAFIGLGSNLDDPQRQLQQAVSAIASLDQTQLVKQSSYYLTAPVGPAGQPDYLNAVVMIDTLLSALDLLDKLQFIENAQGRVRDEKWGARTVDLDILLYGDEQITDQRLIVPHQHMHERNFVMVPLMELVEPTFLIPGKGEVLDLMKKCPDNPIQKINDNNSINNM